MSTTDVSSILSSCDEWDTGTECRAISFAEHLDSLISGDDEVFNSLSQADLREHQRKDPVIGRVLYYVDRKCRPSRRERAIENPCVLQILKQWDKLSALHGILYRAVKDPLTKHKRFQFILPESLKHQALTVDLMFQNVLWNKSVCDYDQYVRSLIDDLQTAMTLLKAYLLLLVIRCLWPTRDVEGNGSLLTDGIQLCTLLLLQSLPNMC
ncbi:hypothetical protein HF521_006909, partial [Silurus meridionalis]